MQGKAVAHAHPHPLCLLCMHPCHVQPKPGTLSIPSLRTTLANGSESESE